MDRNLSAVKRQVSRHAKSAMKLLIRAEAYGYVYCICSIIQCHNNCS